MKSSSERKEGSEAILERHDILINPGLPGIVSESEVTLKSPIEIGKRILILSYLNMLIEAEKRKEEILDYFQRDDLWDTTSPLEKKLFFRPLTNQDQISISWRAESINMMLWAVKKVDLLELPIEQCEVSIIIDHLPSYCDDSSEFLKELSLRTKTELLDQNDLIYRMHWAARYEERNNGSLNVPINGSIAYERHYAINWICNYENLEWDDMVTDT